MAESIKCCDPTPDTIHDKVCRINELVRDAAGMTNKIGSELFCFDPLKDDETNPTCMVGALESIETVLRNVCDKLQTISRNL